MFVEGFTRDVPYYMSLADLFIGKPGPGRSARRLAMRLPVIVERNARTLAQERYNADWIVEQRVGLVVNDFANVAAAVADLLRSGNVWATARQCRRGAQPGGVRGGGLAWSRS